MVGVLEEFGLTFDASLVFRRPFEGMIGYCLWFWSEAQDGRAAKADSGDLEKMWSTGTPIVQAC